MDNIKNNRESGIELFRILSMLVIVAHHYVVNSGLMPLITEQDTLSLNSIFLLIFGWGGKTGINCFILITGYFMCRSSVSLKKFLKLFLWILFYKVVFYLVFTLTGYECFTIKGLLKGLYPFLKIHDGFASAFILFYLFIPFINLFINNISKRQFEIFLFLTLSIYTIMGSSIITKIVFNYITWFSVVYMIGAYLRIYPFKKNYNYGKLSVISLLLSWLSVITIAFTSLNVLGEIKLVYYFVADSNKILAVVTSIVLFLYFKNLKINSRLINTIAASSFGVLLIHANSDIMRQWLWKDTLQNTSYFDSEYLIIHAVLSVVIIYIGCTFIDILRIKFIEKPLFKKAGSAISKTELYLQNKIDNLKLL